MKPIVVVAHDEFTDAAVEESVLSAIGATVLYPRNLTTPEAIEAAIEADALIVARQMVSGELLGRLRRCRIVSRAGTGVDNIDVGAATKYGIWVTNVPDYSVDEVSTHAIALLLAYVRRIPRLVEMTRQGIWDSMLVRPLERLADQTLGVLGFGRIGRAVAKKGIGLGLAVTAHDPFVDAASMQEIGVRSVDFETILRTSDFLTLHMPLSNATHHIIDAKALSLVKPSAFLINTARGGLVDENALLRAVEAGQIAGAALDALLAEPPPVDDPLLRDERIMITPHIGWYSEASGRDMRAWSAEEVVRVFSGERPRYPVNQIEHDCDRQKSSKND